MKPYMSLAGPNFSLLMHYSGIHLDLIAKLATDPLRNGEVVSRRTLRLIIWIYLHSL